jgi:hypothetical protein
MVDRDSNVESGRYLTDGVELYRLIGPIGPDASGYVGIEDCRSLAVVLVSLDDLQKRRLRRVLAAA